MRSRREFGLIGDLTTRWLGAVIGGWLFRRLGFVAPNDAAGHVVVALLGATILLIGIRVLRRVTFVTSGAARPTPPGLSWTWRNTSAGSDTSNGAFSADSSPDSPRRAMTRIGRTLRTGRTQNDYEVNVRAEMQIMALHAKLDSSHNKEVARLARVVDEQQRELEGFRRRLNGTGSTPTSA